MLCSLKWYGDIYVQYWNVYMLHNLSVTAAFLIEGSYVSLTMTSRCENNDKCRAVLSDTSFLLPSKQEVECFSHCQAHFILSDLSHEGDGRRGGPVMELRNDSVDFDGSVSLPSLRLSAPWGMCGFDRPRTLRRFLWRCAGRHICTHRTGLPTMHTEMNSHSCTLTLSTEIGRDWFIATLLMRGRLISQKLTFKNLAAEIKVALRLHVVTAAGVQRASQPMRCAHKTTDYTKHRDRETGCAFQ